MLGKIETLGFHLKQEAALETLTEEIVKSSDIEGEKLPRSLYSVTPSQISEDAEQIDTGCCSPARGWDAGY